MSSMTLSTGKSLAPVETATVEHDHDVPGAGPVRILSVEEGDVPEVPHEVEAELRRPMGKRPSRFTRAELLEQFRDDYEASTYDRPGCLHDWRQVHPELTVDLVGIALEVENGPKRLPKVPDPSPISPPPPRPTVAALGVCYVPLLLATCLLAALRTGGAIAWDWAWVLSPVWLPMVLGTIALILASIILAFLDERDAARRRAS
jgi:hypothetical protein